MLRLQHSIAFIKNRGEKTTRFSAGYRVHSSCYLRRDSEKFVWIIVTNQRYFLCGSRVLQYFIVFRYYSAVPAQAEHRFQWLSRYRRWLRLAWIRRWWIRSRWSYRDFSPVRVICCVCSYYCRDVYLYSARHRCEPAIKCPTAAHRDREFSYCRVLCYCFSHSRRKCAAIRVERNRIFWWFRWSGLKIF